MSYDVSPLIRDRVWVSIRERFTEPEKAELRKHVTGEAICPKGICIDWDGLFAADANLYGKLTRAVFEETPKP